MQHVPAATVEKIQLNKEFSLRLTKEPHTKINLPKTMFLPWGGVNNCLRVYFYLYEPDSLKKVILRIV